MKSLLHLCTPEDIDKILPLVAAFHGESGIATTPELRDAGIRPLLEGTPHGAAYLIGPRRAPVGYLVLSFGWSVEFGGLDAFLDEIYVRPAVRGRGMGAEALSALIRALQASDIKALHLEVEPGSAAARLYERLGFAPRLNYGLMSWRAPRVPR